MDSNYIRPSVGRGISSTNQLEIPQRNSRIIDFFPASLRNVAAYLDKMIRKRGATVPMGTSEYELGSHIADALRRSGLDAGVNIEHTDSGTRLLDVQAPTHRNFVSSVIYAQDPQQSGLAVKNAHSLFSGEAVKCVVILRSLRKSSLSSSDRVEYEWRMVHRSSSSDSGWMLGSLDQLALFIGIAPARPTGPNEQAHELFSALAMDMEGALTAVLPLVSATGERDLDIRLFLGTEYHLDYIIASHDTERPHFSSNCGRAEVLVVCCPRGSDIQPRPKTRAINLSYNPSTRGEAAAIVRTILEGDRSNTSAGEVHEVGTTDIESGDWRKRPDAQRPIGQ